MPSQTQNNSIIFKNKSATTSRQIRNILTNTIIHTTYMQSNRILAQLHYQKLHATPIQLTTSQVQASINHSKINNTTDKINITHLKSLRPLVPFCLTHLYTPALNTIIIPHMLKLVNIIPIPKTNKNNNPIYLSLH